MEDLNKEMNSTQKIGGRRNGEEILNKSWDFISIFCWLFFFLLFLSIPFYLSKRRRKYSYSKKMDIKLSKTD